jgi:hypothetical protein
MKRLLPLAFVCGVTGACLTGCCSWCQRPSAIVSVPVPPPSDLNCPPGTTPPINVPVAPPGGLVTPPPPAAPGTPPPPPPAFPNQPAASNLGPSQLAEDNWRPVEGRQIQPLPRQGEEPPPPVFAPIAGQPGIQPPDYPSTAEPPRQPPLARIQLSPPEPLQDEASPPPVSKIDPPQSDSPQQEPPASQYAAPPPPPATTDKGNNLSFPIGIPQFAYVKDRVATGLRPSLDEGLDWLQRRGYRTVLYLRRPGDPDNSDRNQVEKRGMKFLALEIAPNTLDENLIDEFMRIVRDSTNYPLFVYDRDGSLTGGLWYIYFRRIDNASEDVARVRAGSLGFREDRDPAHREMWRAVRELNNEAAP